MTEEQLERAIRLSTEINELRNKIASFKKEFVGSPDGSSVKLVAGATLLDSFVFEQDAPSFVIDFINAYNNYLLKKLASLEAEFENL